MYNFSNGVDFRKTNSMKPLIPQPFSDFKKVLRKHIISKPHLDSVKHTYKQEINNK